MNIKETSISRRSQLLDLLNQFCRVMESIHFSRTSIDFEGKDFFGGSSGIKLSIYMLKMAKSFLRTESGLTSRFMCRIKTIWIAS